MIKKISRYSLQQIFIESLENCSSFKIIDGLNPFHIKLNGRELYIYIKNLSPAYFSNPDVWRVQLPKKDEFESIKNGPIDFVLLGYDADNEVYTIWHPKWAKQRLNNGESVSFYSRLTLQEEAASTQTIKRLSLNNEGEVIAFPREYIEFLLFNLNTFFQNESDYVAMGSKRRPEANDAYKTFCDLKNIGLFASHMANDGYSAVTISNYCRAIRDLIKDGYITRYRKIFLSCDRLSEYTDAITEFCNQPEISERNAKWHNTLSAALRAYIGFLINYQSNETLPSGIAVDIHTSNYLDVLISNDIYDSLGEFLHDKGYNDKTIVHYQKSIRTLRETGLIIKYKSLFEPCNSIEDLRSAFKKFFAIHEVDQMNKARHHDLSAIFEQLIDYLQTINFSQLALTSQGNETSQNQSNTDKTSPTTNGAKEVASEKDWETPYTDSKGKLTQIANPVLIDKLRPFLDTEYASPVRAYNEIEDFYGDRYSKMDMGDWMKLFKAINWENTHTPSSSTSTHYESYKTKNKTEILRVEYPDGRIIQHPKAIDTFVEVIENNYPDLIHELNILHANVNLVTKKRSKQYASVQKQIIDGWLVFTNINTRRKREDLLKISEELELGLKVELVSIATGEIITPNDNPKSSTRKKIEVTFPNGRRIEPNKVLEALVEVVKYAGPERVRDLNITVCADNLVLKTPKPRYVKSCKPVGNGWLVNTCSDTPTKYEQIKYISDKLSLNLSVKITN